MTSTDRMVVQALCGICNLNLERGRVSSPHRTLQSALARCSGYEEGKDGKMEATLTLGMLNIQSTLPFVEEQVEKMATCKFNPGRHVVQK